MQYKDFVDLNFTPSTTDVICEFHVVPKEISAIEAMGGVAAESSIGTWTELTTLTEYAEKLHATVFQINGNDCRIAYPIELFELGNMPNILSSLAGNVFGLEALRSLRLNDVNFPEKLVKSFKGPKFGIEGIRQILKIEGRPLVGTIIKPKLGLKTRDHAEIAYKAWIGGCDLVKDDENLSSQKFNIFENRLAETMEKKELAEEETGERKGYIINVTAEVEEMIRRAEYVHDHGGRYMMVDVIACGFSALQTIRNQELNLAVHAHRAGHAAFTRMENHGINMKVIAKVSRIVGVDQLHVGTAVGKMSESKREVLENVETLKKPVHGLKTVLPVASGGLHPALIPDLINIFGIDFVIQAGGGKHGHPQGTSSGAQAVRQAVDSVLKNIALVDYAEDHVELAMALEKWS